LPGGRSSFFQLTSLTKMMALTKRQPEAGSACRRYLGRLESSRIDVVFERSKIEPIAERSKIEVVFERSKIELFVEISNA